MEIEVHQVRVYYCLLGVMFEMDLWAFHPGKVGTDLGDSVLFQLPIAFVGVRLGLGAMSLSHLAVRQTREYYCLLEVKFLMLVPPPFDLDRMHSVLYLVRTSFASCHLVREGFPHV